MQFSDIAKAEALRRRLKALTDAIVGVENGIRHRPDLKLVQVRIGDIDEPVSVDAQAMVDAMRNQRNVVLTQLKELGVQNIPGA
jgi:hypothetical protein